MEDTCIPKQCYFMLKSMDENNRVNWVTSIKNMFLDWVMDMYGLPRRWVTRIFLNNVWQRLKDCSFQEWSNSVNESEKLSSYKQYKSLLITEKYLLVTN